MMRLIELYINGVTIEPEEKKEIIADSVNDIGCVFNFSCDWEGLSKIAVFTAGSRSITVPLEDRPVPLPWETLQMAGVAYEIGVYGYEGEILVRQTTPVQVGYVRTGTKRNAAESSQFTPTIVQKLLKDISDLSKRIDALTEGSSGVAWVEL